MLFDNPLDFVDDVFQVLMLPANIAETAKVFKTTAEKIATWGKRQFEEEYKRLPAGARKKLDRLFNHPSFWVKPGVKVAYKGITDKGWTSAFFKGVTVRSLALDCAPYYANGVGNNLSNIVLPGSIAGALVDAYNAYYSRLNHSGETIVSSSKTIREDIYRILLGSFMVYASMRQMKRYYDGAQSSFAGNRTPMLATMGINPYASCRIKETNKTLPLINLAGTILKDNSIASGTTSTLGYLTVEKPRSVDASSDTFKHGYPTISNKVWTEMVNKLRDLPISTSTTGLLDYLLDGVFVDNSSEDNYEIYAFQCPTAKWNDKWLSGTDPHSFIGPIPEDLEASKFGPDSNDYYEVFDHYYNLVTTTLLKDPAYPAILSELGLFTLAKMSTDDLQNTWKRDIAGRVIKYKVCTDDFYQFMENATYNAYYAGNQLPPSPSEGGWEAVMTISNVDSNAISFGRRPYFTAVENVNPVPENRIGEAGEFASALKFSSCFHLALLPVMVFRDWTPVVVSPANMNFVGNWLQNRFSSIDVNPEGSWDAILDATNKRAAATLLPCGLSPVLTGDAVSERFAGIPYKATMRIGYQVPGSYDSVTAYDLDSVKDYQWSNLLLGADALADVSTKLFTMAQVWSLEP